MSNKRAGYSFLLFGLVALAGGIACLGWAKSLGGFNFIGATAGIFLAMLSFSRYAALRRNSEMPRSVPASAPTTHDSLHAPLTSRRPVMQDEELAARLAALRAPRPEADADAWDDPEPEPYPEPAWESAMRAAEDEPLESSVVVTEGPPLDSALGDLLPLAPEAPRATLAPAAPLSPIEPAPAPAREPGGLRQMDELRAEIARLREGSRKRLVVSPVPPGLAKTPSTHESASTPGVQRAGTDPFARTEFSGLPGDAPAHPSPAGEAFPRTEFTELSEAPREGASFSKTEFLGPVELRRDN